jgi:AcrR family transcriptional regulator
VVTQVRKTNTKQKILDAASDLFYRHGPRGVGMDQVIARSGVAKSTMYVHFRTKDELVAAYISRTDDSWMSQLRAAAESAGDSPAEQLVGLFEALVDAFERHGSFGCPFISVAVEAAADSPAHANTVSHTRRRHEWLRELSAAAGATDPDALAKHIGLLIDGALASGRLVQDRGVVDAAKAAARCLVECHTRTR